ncbi:hypothetical protein ACF0H5_004550 [Mactra antiquata]
MHKVLNCDQLLLNIVQLNYRQYKKIQNCAFFLQFCLKDELIERSCKDVTIRLLIPSGKDVTIRLLIPSGKDVTIRLLIPLGKDVTIRLLIPSGKDSVARLFIPSGKDASIQACHYVFTVKVEQIYRYSVAELFCHV